MPHSGRRRRASGNPPLTPWARAFLEERKGALDGWTEEELDALARRTLETPEVERLLREDDEVIRRRRESRERARYSIEGATPVRLAKRQRRKAQSA